MIKWIQGQLPSFEEVPTVITIKYPILQCYIAMSSLPAYLCHYRWESRGICYPLVHLLLPFLMILMSIILSLPIS